MGGDVNQVTGSDPLLRQFEIAMALKQIGILAGELIQRGKGLLEALFVGRRAGFPAHVLGLNQDKRAPPLAIGERDQNVRLHPREARPEGVRHLAGVVNEDITQSPAIQARCLTEESKEQSFWSYVPTRGENIGGQ
jgi:hypothetical protein